MEKEEEQNIALSSKRKVKKGPNQGQNSKGGENEKKDLLKVKFFRCGEFGHYVTYCPNRNKDKKGQENTTISVEIDELNAIFEEFALKESIPPGGGA